jgi:cobalt-zinc-cadmium efflux system protein
VTRQRRLLIALALNVGLVVAQVVFGLTAHSLGLLSDAGHNLTDVAAVVISLGAVSLTRRRPTPERSYGYHRGTVLAALVNAASLLAVTVFIFFEAFRRLEHPQPVDGAVVAAVAFVAFAINAAAALALRDHSHDLNMRSALLHLTSDAAASLGVAAAGIAIVLDQQLRWLDPVVSMAIGVLVAVAAWRLLRQSVDVLLESAPTDLDLAELTRAIATVDGVDGVHDMHVWSLSSEFRALSAHIILSGYPTLEQAQVVGERVKRAIAEPFAIAHSTLELECEACVDDGAEPCAMDRELPVGAPAAGTTGGGRH